MRLVGFQLSPQTAETCINAASPGYHDSQVARGESAGIFATGQPPMTRMALIAFLGHQARGRLRELLGRFFYSRRHCKTCKFCSKKLTLKRYRFISAYVRRESTCDGEVIPCRCMDMLG